MVTGPFSSSNTAPFSSSTKMVDVGDTDSDGDVDLGGGDVIVIQLKAATVFLAQLAPCLYTSYRHVGLQTSAINRAINPSRHSLISLLALDSYESDSVHAAARPADFGPV
jgi:hypothetical protein